MRTGRFIHGCFSIEEGRTTSKVVAMGGRDSGHKNLASAEILDVASMQWQDLPDLPFGVYGNKGIESVIGPNMGFSVASKRGYDEDRIIGLRKNQNGTYYWQELTTQLITSRYNAAVVNVPESMVPSC